MQGRRPGEQQNKASGFGIDPKQPIFTGSFPQTGGTDPHRVAPLGGGGGSQQFLPPQAGQSFNPPLAGYIDNRYPAGSGYTGFPIGSLKVRDLRPYSRTPHQARSTNASQSVQVKYDSAILWTVDDRSEELLLLYEYYSCDSGRVEPLRLCTLTGLN